ncbi:hypothetical protein COM84_04015 [Bacillus thuringiensis]|nr:hypothetical protein COM84_04015 [Bacillus thuringiensis]
MIYTIATFKSEVIKSDSLFFITIKMFSRMIFFAVYAVNFTIEKSPLIDVESKTLSAIIVLLECFPFLFFNRNLLW